MKHRVLLFSFCFVLLHFMEEAQGGGRVSIVFKRYRNPSSRRLNGHCCDLKMWGRCGKCDTYFKICLTDFANPRSVRQCPLGYIRTGRLGRDDFHMRLSMSRPFPALKGYVGVYVESWDRDTFTPDDLIDKLTLTLPVGRPDPNNHVTSVYLRTLRGGRASLTAEINVFCDSNYYGMSCTTYCRPRNGHTGHYTCNLHGQKICRKNWYGGDCNKHCVEYDDSYHGHFKCDHQGRKLCRSGWYGHRCLRYCLESSNNGPGHYTCDSRGNKICRPGWYGVDCKRHCVASDDDVNGHYTCESDGRKVCRAGWYRDTGRSRDSGRSRETGWKAISARRVDGRSLDTAAGPVNQAECTKYCIAHDDDIAGHSMCDSNGDKACTQGWYGDMCTVYCIGHDDVIHGHYTCDRDRGAHVCLPGWEPPSCTKCAPGFFPPNCTTYCKPHGDHSPHAGHFTCDKKGNKQCRMWWYGPDCTTYCVPHDDRTNGHYSCDSQGTKICHAGWYGQNCTWECNATSNAIACDLGHAPKNCSPRFSPPDCKKCLPGLYGANCTNSCIKVLVGVGNSTSDVQGLLGVSNVVCSKRGEVECRKWWHGEACDVYCVPHDDVTNGHYICDANGRKRCIMGWMVPGCKTKS